VNLTDESSRGDGYCPIIFAASTSSGLGAVEEREQEVLRGRVSCWTASDSLIEKKKHKKDGGTVLARRRRVEPRERCQLPFLAAGIQTAPDSATSSDRIWK